MSSPGVNIAGYVYAVLGIGAVARRTRRALQTAGVPVSVQPLPADFSPALPDSVTPAEPPRYPVNLLCVNADGIEGAHAELGDAWFSGRYTIGFWWWEAGAFPERWTRAFDLVDELWVGSHHVADALAPVSPVPVLRMPPPLVTPAAGPSLDRAALGLAASGPLFVTVFDHGSVLERKNPIGAIQAFRAAFPEGREAALLVKSVGGDRHPTQAAMVESAAADDPRVRVLDGELPEREMAAILAGCDCFVSLHRSEGFGLALAEAMLARRPVVATAYGGPRDFLHPGNGFPVQHGMVRIGPGNDPYSVDGWWAEPDLEHAAACMRAVADDPAEAGRRGERAAAEVGAAYSLEAAGRAMGERIAFVSGLRPPREGRRRPILTEELVRRIRSEPPAPPKSLAARLRRPLRAAALRMIRPQTVHQRQVDEEVVRTLRTLEERVEGIAAAQATVLAELEALRRKP